MTHLRIKICGITTEADACRAAALGADAVGLNFYAASPRCVAPAEAQRILRALPPFVDPVGLFVNQPLSEVFERVGPFGRIRTLQLHGNHGGPGEAFPFRVIVAFPVKDQDSLRDIARYLNVCREAGRLPDALLVDAHQPGQYGGTGRTAPWDLLADFHPDVPVLLAGGLTPENVAVAVRLVRPYGVDVASGVEQKPGLKDTEKIRRFIDNAREAAARYP